eukprot:Tamp_18479.p2 GENE.Tamp_18479~~Tamp_18479.p2  ORF type:complete len:101 (+),score=0.98 Tamp_18479:454-756(+)
MQARRLCVSAWLRPAVPHGQLCPSHKGMRRVVCAAGGPGSPTTGGESVSVGRYLSPRWEVTGLVAVWIDRQAGRQAGRQTDSLYACMHACIALYGREQRL